jgi:hypothetical protein
MTLGRLLLLGLLVCASVTPRASLRASGAERGARPERVERWGTFDLALRGPQFGNPFCDVTLTARFEQGSRAVEVEGFYDGDGTYRVRFMPDALGEWTYRTKSNRKELDGQNGRLVCVAPVAGNHGPVRVRNRYHFAYADGTPYFPIGTTCYVWNHQGDRLEEGTLKTLKAAPFNKLRMCVFPHRYAYNTNEPVLYPFEGKPPREWDFTRFNPKFFRHLERRIGDLRALGIEADLILFHPYDRGHWGFDRMPAAADDRYLRYVVARLAAYRNVWWSLANEFDFMKTKTTADWDRFFQIVQKSDPYQHPRSIHNALRLYDHNKPWVTHASIQNGSAVADFGRAELLRSAYEKPVVYDEVCYEGNIPLRWGDLSAEEMVHRFWQGTVAGTYVTHGETYLHPQDILWWTKGGELRGQSPPRLAFLRKILEEGPPEGLDPMDKWRNLQTAGQKGEYYLIYFGKQTPAQWRFELPKGRFPIAAGAKFRVEILDTWNMTVTPVERTFAPRPKGKYVYADDVSPPVKLPGKPYLALRIRKVAPADPPTTGALRVDLHPNVQRSDILTRGWENWKVPEGQSSSAKFGAVTVALRKAGTVGTGLATSWWKPGYDYPATMASDGVFVKDGNRGGQLEIVLRGLAPGRHSLVTYHNSLWDEPISTLAVSVNGVEKVRGVKPSVRVKHDDDAASAYVEFEAVAGKDVVIGLTPDGSGKIDNVILNGFALDTTDPARRALKPSPADGDEHAPEAPTLSWKPSPTAVSHHVYLGTDPVAVARATPASDEFMGNLQQAGFATAWMRPDSRRMYYWRVDEVHRDRPGRPTRGDVWRFRIRHLAFPGAEGYGRFAIGGRGGKVYEVTNLNDSGPGSLREACEASGPRTVVFRVGGVIKLKSRIVIRNPYLTVAGQTAPGDGICVRGATFGCSDTHDVIIRYLRIRVGDESGKTYDGAGARGCDHVIYDHCSISWSIDEGFSSRAARNITLQRSIIAEALNLSVHSHYKGTGRGHSFAGSISGDVGSFHHNLLAHCAGRNWSLAGGLDRTGRRLAGRLDIRNNVVYNWHNRTTDGGVLGLNFVNNLYLPGPATRAFTLLKPDPGDAERGMRCYMAGNVIEGKQALDGDNWKAAVLDAKGLALVRSAKELYPSYVTTQTARDAYENVLADVGANLPKLDSFDRRILEDVRKRSHRFTGSKGKLPGIIDSQADVGGWPEYRSAVPPVDADHDGIPDAWERAHGLDLNDPSDGARYVDSSGYTQLERYLNSLVEPSAQRRERNR